MMNLTWKSYLLHVKMNYKLTILLGDTIFINLGSNMQQDL